MAQGQTASSNNVTTWGLTLEELITTWVLAHKQLLSLRGCSGDTLGLIRSCGWAGAESHSQGRHSGVVTSKS